MISINHHLLLYCIYSALVDSFRVSSNPLSKWSKHRGRPIPGRIRYCKDLHTDGRKHFLNFCKNGRPLVNELFEEMKASCEAFFSILLE